MFAGMTFFICKLGLHSLQYSQSDSAIQWCCAGAKMSHFYTDTIRPSTNGLKGHSAPMATTSVTSSAHQSNASSRNDLRLRAASYDDDSSAGEEIDADDVEVASARALVEEVMRAREREYCDFETWSIFAGTFNVNGKSAVRPLGPWLTHGLQDTPPHLYVLGFQELDLSHQAFLLGTTPREQEWAALLHSEISTIAKYEEVKRVRLIGMLLIVFARRDVAPQVRRSTLRTAAQGTGLLNVMGNKGGVAVSVQLHDSKVCFVNSHLAAGTGELARRNQDYRELCSKLLFAATSRPVTIFEHDLVIWVGDMNYRLDDVTSNFARDLLQSADDQTVAKEKLLAMDQLNRMRRMRHAFADFDEGGIDFAPTYKYDTGTDEWDSSEKARCPAWCDRVLWYAPAVGTDGPPLRLHSYDACMAVRFSDHKPVRALFSADIRKINERKRQKTLEKALKEVDRLANESLPQLTLDCHEFDFGTVKFLEPITQTLTVRNLGRLPCEYLFRGGPNHPKEKFCKPWLEIANPRRRVLPSGEMQIDLSVMVDAHAVRQLSDQCKPDGSCSLDDLLVLHLRHGRDFFVTVTAKYAGSCFGRSLQQLYDDEMKDRGDSGPVDRGPLPPEPIPRQLWMLGEHVRRIGLRQHNLFECAAPQADFALIRDYLDDPESRTDSMRLWAECARGAHSYGHALLRMLDSLAEPIVPQHMLQAFLRAGASATVVAGELCVEMVRTRLSPVHAATFQYIATLLRDLLAHKQWNGYSAADLCSIFAPMLFGLNNSHEPSDGANAARFLVACIGPV